MRSNLEWHYTTATTALRHFDTTTLRGGGGNGGYENKHVVCVENKEGGKDLHVFYMRAHPKIKSCLTLTYSVSAEARNFEHETWNVRLYTSFQMNHSRWGDTLRRSSEIDVLLIQGLSQTASFASSAASLKYLK